VARLKLAPMGLDPGLDPRVYLLRITLLVDRLPGQARSSPATTE
jgi:hypothetical protein